MATPTVFTSYPSDLSDREWAILACVLPPPKPGGRPRTVACARSSMAFPMCYAAAVSGARCRASTARGPRSRRSARDLLAWQIASRTATA